MCDSAERTFSLPFPPSVNQMFRNLAGKGRVKSSEYRRWLNVASSELMAQRVRPIDTPVTITVDLDHRRRGDADNRYKAISDLLVQCGVIPDDSKKHVHRVSIGWEPVVECRVTVRRCDG